MSDTARDYQTLEPVSTEGLDDLFSSGTSLETVEIRVGVIAHWWVEYGASPPPVLNLLNSLKPLFPLFLEQSRWKNVGAIGH